MLEFLTSKYADILIDIKEKKDISEETDGKLKKALEEFEGIFNLRPDTIIVYKRMINVR